jgi:ABC-type multidrug transport system fused ATPase/permease subunit
LSDKYQYRQDAQLEAIRITLDNLNQRTQAANKTATIPSPMGADEIKDIEEGMSKLSIASGHIAIQQEILGKLRFPNRQARYNSIHDAHQVTFRWAARDDNYDFISQQRILAWLRTGSGVFWVSGKPGSGKSTFMKYLADNEETQTALTS